MKINTITLSHFGKFHHKTLQLKPGINLVQGANESGKSTIHAFIKGMLLGIEKTRGREGKDDVYKRYLPWDTPTLYSGSMDVEMESNRYRITRNFYKETKESLVHNLSNGRSEVVVPGEGLPILEGVNRINFQNTVSMEQLKLETDDAMIHEVQNYYANLATAQNGEISISKALDHLKKERKSIAIDSTREQLQQLSLQLYELQQVKEQKKILEMQLAQVDDTRLQQAREQVTTWQERKDKILETICNYRMIRNQIVEYEETLNKRNSLKEIRKRQYNSSRINGITYGIACAFCITAVVQQWIWMFVFLAAFLGIVLFRLIYPRVEARREVWVDTSKEEEYRMNLFKQEKQLANQLQEYAKSFSLEHYPTDQVADQLKVKVEQELQQLTIQLRKLEAENDAERTKRTMKLQQLEERIGEEELVKNKKEKLVKQKEVEQQQLQAIDTAIHMIQTMSASIHDSFGSVVNEELSNMVRQVTNHRYKRVYVDEKLRIFVECESTLIPIQRLSTGTIHQIYFALRMIYANFLFPDSKLPLLIDESFAYYDNERLREVLKILPQDRQIIMFTCQDREKKMLEELKIPYHYIVV